MTENIYDAYLDGKLELREDIPPCNAAFFMDKGIHKFKYEESVDGQTRFLTCYRPGCEFELELAFEIKLGPYTVKRERPIIRVES